MPEAKWDEDSDVEDAHVSPPEFVTGIFLWRGVHAPDREEAIRAVTKQTVCREGARSELAEKTGRENAKLAPAKVT